MEKRLTYTIQIERDEDGIYVVSVPALPGCFTEGKTVEEAMTMAQDAIKGWINMLVKEGEPIPVEAPQTLTTLISVSDPLAV